MKRTTRIIALLVVLSMVVPLAACISGTANTTKPAETVVAETPASTTAVATEQPAKYPVINDGKPLTLRILVNGEITQNMEPTKENPAVKKNYRDVAAKFQELHPNVTIEWLFKPSDENAVQQWWNSQLAAGTAPVVGEKPNALKDNPDAFTKLDQYLDEPNEYEPDNTKWRDMFYDYEFKFGDMLNTKGELIGLPITINAGPPAMFFYNKAIFKELGVEVPRDWEDLVEVGKKAVEKGHIGVTAFSWAFGANPWETQFMVGPPALVSLQDKIDYNKDGNMENKEITRAACEGVFLFRDNPISQEMWQAIKRLHTTTYPKGWDQNDYEPQWVEGNVAVKMAGAWNIETEDSNTNRKFEYGKFPFPVLSSRGAPHITAKIEWTDKGPWQPDPANYKVIVEESVKVQGGDAARRAGIQWLKFITTIENQNYVFSEGRAFCLPSIKGATMPPYLTEWLEQPFPKLPQVKWPGEIHASVIDDIKVLVFQYTKDEIKDEEFFTKYDALYLKGIAALVEDLKASGVDVSGWTIAK